MTSEAPRSPNADSWALWISEFQPGTEYIAVQIAEAMEAHAQAMVAAERDAICAPLTKDEEWNAALSYRHDLGLLSDTEQVALMRDAEWWHNALSHRIRARTPNDAKAALDALLKAEREAGRVEGLREAAGFHKQQQSRWQGVIDKDETAVSQDRFGALVANHSAYHDAILALIEKETGQ